MSFTRIRIRKIAAAAIVLATLLAAFLPAGHADANDGVTLCQFNVFPIDRDPKGTNLRSGPGAENRVVASITDQDSEIEVTGVSGKWLRIHRAQSVEGKIFLDGEAWIFGALTGVTARRATKLHAAANENSPVVGSMPADDQGTVLSCEGKWVQVQTKQGKGWMAPETHCGNPVTTCV